MFWSKKGPNLVQMAQTVLQGLETQTRQHFHKVLSHEYEFIMKYSYLDCTNLNFDHFGQKGPNIGPVLLRLTKITSSI